MPDCFKYLEKLVSFHTMSDVAPETDMPNAPLIHWAAERFAGFGFSTRVIESSRGKLNLFAWSGPMTGRGPDERGGLLLSGHTDTVGCDPALWTSDPWTLTPRDGRVYGLGSCDMKGFLACAMAFAEKLSAARIVPQQGLGILLTCDEETSMQGARTAAPVLAEMGVAPALAVVGEPTELTPIFGHKGYMARSVEIAGRACHSSNPTLGVNAVKTAADVIEALTALEERLKGSVDPDFDHPDAPEVPYPTLNIGSIRGGDSVNRVCSSVRLEFDVRPTPSHPAEKVRDELDALEAELNRRHPGGVKVSALYPDLDPFGNSDPDVRRMVERIAAVKGEFVSYATEASFLQRLGPTVVMGPGSIRQAHGVDEFCAVSELEGCMGLLEKLFLRCGGASASRMRSENFLSGGMPRSD
ncbi:acetylornithine deacetylase [uncultured Sutterella sp.]|uniref:acetylornithine deacetylase n=1 Tax=uncultured Sutterella sp. TaxID=286133 RepID=UPI0025DF32D0|nr:acetylornithine deacetylase [uncultured Sutterella sp.]